MTALPQPQPDQPAHGSAAATMRRLARNRGAALAPHIEDGNQLLTSEQAAHYTTYSPQGLANLRSAGKGPAYIKIPGGAVGYRLADLIAWQGQHRVATLDQV